MSLLTDYQRFYKVFPVTASIIVLATFISLITLFGRNITLVGFLYFNENLIYQGQIWRLITPIFLHFSMLGIFFLHLAFNLLWFWQFAKPIEAVLSSRFLLFFIVTTGVASNVIQAIFTDVLFGGLSGVVYALLGFLWSLAKFDRYSRLRVEDNIAYFLIGFMLLSAIGVFGQGIANAAHISGFVVGVIIALVHAMWKRARLN